MTKTERFEIFKRDGFTCQYCGRRPPDVVLEVDHIDPRANGGSNDPLNLVTACFDCNRGKAARKLGDVVPRPDTDLAYLGVQQEIAESKRYLEASSIRQELYEKIRDRLMDIWCETYESEYGPSKVTWQKWLRVFTPEELEEAIKLGTRLLEQETRPQTGRLVRYVSGILWHRREKASETVQ